MFEKIKEKIKNRGFWAGVCTTIGAVLAGTLSAPDAVINLIQQLIGG